MRKVYYIRRPRRSVNVKHALSRGELSNESGAGAPGSASTPPLILSSAWVPRPFALGNLRPESESLAGGATPASNGAETRPTKSARTPTASPKTDGTLAQFAPPPGSAMETDERFQAVTSRLAMLAARERHHDHPPVKIQEAVRATKQPAEEPLAMGMRSHVDAMHAEAEKKDARKSEAKEKSFEKLVNEAIEKLTPKTASDMEDFGKDNNKVMEVRDNIHKDVSQQEAETKGNVETEAKQDPEPTEKEDEPAALPADPLTGPPRRVGAKDVLPEPKSEAEVSMEADKREATDDLAKTGLTEDQLAEGNEPLFNQALAAKKEVLENSDAAPARFRETEREFLTHSAAEVGEEENITRFEMRGIHAAKTGHVHNKQDELAKLRESERQRIAQQIEGIYLFTKIAVLAKLAMLDRDVDTMFERDFQAFFFTLQTRVQLRMEDWKDERYSSLIGGSYRWWRDKFRDINKLEGPMRIYREEQETYVNKMTVLLHRIAQHVEQTLAECKAIIDDGRQKISYLISNTRDKNLKSFAKQAASRISMQFESLEESVNEKKNQLATRLANRYKDSREKVDKWIEEEKARNRSLLVKLANKAREIYEAVVRLKDRLMSVLREARDVILSIIAHPIRFLGNLVDAVKQGISQFRDHIAENLKEGVLRWLFDPKTGTDIEVPKDFSLKSIFGLAMSILGITKDKLRAKAATLIGEGNLRVLEKVWELISVAYREGPAGLWEYIKEFLGDIKDTILKELKEWAITQIVKAAIKKLILMFNPVGAFIAACMAIYDLVKFFFERFDQIVEMVKSIFSSIAEIVGGKIAAAADRIEQAMVRSIPLILSFLASFLGIPDPGPTLRKIVNGLRERVDKALDWVVGKLKGLALAGLGVAKGVVGKVRSLFFPKKHFVVGSEEHSVEATRSGDDYEINIHSRTFTVRDFITHAKAAEDKEPKPKPGIGKDIAALEKEYARWTKIKITGDIERDTERLTKEKEEIYEKVVDLIERVYLKLPTARKLPPSKIKWGLLDSRGRATSVTADTLTKEPPESGEEGSTPQESIPGWEKEKPGERTREGRIRAHLLHHRLHGPGTRKNLTPTSSQTNQLMYNRVEEPSLAAVKAGKILEYHTNVEYASSGKSPLIDFAKHIKIESVDKEKKTPIGAWEGDNY